MSDGRIEPQGWGTILPGAGAPIVGILEQRDGIATLVLLDDGSELEAFDCAWGRDVGEVWEHVSLNCSPLHKEREFHFVQTANIPRLVDPSTGATLYVRAEPREALNGL